MNELEIIDKIKNFFVEKGYQFGNIEFKINEQDATDLQYFGQIFLDKDNERAIIELNYDKNPVVTERLNSLPHLRKYLRLTENYVYHEKKKDRWGEYYKLYYLWVCPTPMHRLVSIIMHELGHYFSKTKQHEVPDREVWIDLFEMKMTSEFLGIPHNFDSVYDIKSK